jgi:plasmid stabilization system protein ParE
MMFRFRRPMIGLRPLFRVPPRNPYRICVQEHERDSYIRFARAFDDRIELVRVLHGARDIQRMLDAEGEDEE